MARRPSLTPTQKRLARAMPPPPSTASAPCPRCGAHYLDYPDGQDAHEAVFGHPPRIDEEEGSRGAD